LAPGFARGLVVCVVLCCVCTIRHTCTTLILIVAPTLLASRSFFTRLFSASAARPFAFSAVLPTVVCFCLGKWVSDGPFVQSIYSAVSTHVRDTRYRLCLGRLGRFRWVFTSILTSTLSNTRRFSSNRWDDGLAP